MKKVFLLLILMALGGVSYSQVRIVDNDSLKSVITASDKPYKLIYVFCDYCRPSVERFPKLLEVLKGNSDVALFPICAQGYGEVAEYLKRNGFSETIYLINQKRKIKMIDLYNPIKFTCKLLHKQLDIPTDKMGASDYCLLDKDNKVVLQTNWEMPDSLYFGQLKEYFARFRSLPDE